ncbi:HGxxPAAW family protein [Streptomyces sp. NRRL WC-3744]|uniref:HGxxPAAW family protein n=1 Tax=Streptomyces sp. NRRL WC-3744 TaxID=1463935 RepID=UPI0004C56295|nr:HGxxPAAW family protein [Streptomyces sp. NRRL WC-3744]
MSLYDEGHTIAGWTGVAIATAGGTVVGLGVCTASLHLVGAGLAVVVLSVLVTWALHLSGWGKPPGVRPREQWGMRVRDTQARQGHPGCVGCRLAGRGRPAEAPASLSASAPGALPAASIPLSPVE